MRAYYEQDGIAIYHGNCLDVLPLCGDVDHVITDPPYSEWVHAKVRRGGSIHTPDRADGGPKRPVISTSAVLGFEALTDDVRTAVAAYIAARCRRWSLVFCDVESAHLWRDAVEAAGFEHVRTGAWIKLGATPQFTGDRPASGLEAIAISHRRGRKRWNGGGTHAVWSAPTVHSRGSGARLHTTQKPEALMTQLVADFTDAGELICDPFMGSGTTLVAAKRLGRRAIGIEREERYCEAAARRLAQGALPLIEAAV